MHMPDIITNSNWRCWYFLAAVIGSLIYGYFAAQIFQVDPRPKGWQRFHQHWLNFLGAVMGWTAGWVVLNRWLSCPAFMCADEPRFSTAVLAVAAFIGMAGLMPQTIVTGVASMKAVVETYFKKITGTDEKPAPGTTPTPAASEAKS
jgi:hypothetical protein